MVNIGIIGYGYWGPNIARNFQNTTGINVAVICDASEERLKVASKLYPGTEVTRDCNEILYSPKIDAVAIITPVFTHHELAKKALNNGKHIFIEKPFTSSVAQAEELIELAGKKGLLIMVDHTFLFTGAVQKMKEILNAGLLGELYYFDSTRVNLGLFQKDVNVIWDLAPHDLSVMDYLIGQKPTAVVATGVAHYNGLEDVAFMAIYFANKMIAHINVNWLSPVKLRTTLIGGDGKMLLWNDLDPDEKIKIYDKGVKITNSQGVYDLLVSYRSGDVLVPKVAQTEALKLEAEYFLDCVTTNKTPINDGFAGLRVVKILEAANVSLKQKGGVVTL